MKRIPWLHVLVGFLSFAGVADGQVNPGTPSWSASDGGQYDTINLQNLNVSLNVPVTSKSGAFPFNFALSGGQSYVHTYSGYIYPGIDFNPVTGLANGVLGTSSALFFANFSTSTAATCPSGDGSGSATKYSGWYVQTSDGATHWLPSTDVSYQGSSCSSSFTDHVIDGTGYTVSVTGTVSSVYDRSGTSLSDTTIKDSNGNTISWNYSTGIWTDSLGVTAMTQASGGNSWSWSDVNGGSPAVSVTTTGYTLKTAYGCTGLNDTAGSTPVPTSISFPDSTTLGIAYEPTPGYSSDRTGRITTLTMRNGSSTVAFNYNPSSASHDGLNCTYLVPNSMTRTTSDGTVTYTLAFSLISGSNYKETNTKIDIGGNKTVYTFTGLTSTGNAASPTAQALTQVQYYGNTGTVSSPSYSSTPTRQDVYCYNGASSSCSTATVTEPVTEVDVYTTLAGMSNSSRTQTKYDAYGNVTTFAQYDFGASSAAKTTNITYGNAPNATGVCQTFSNNINNKRCEVDSYIGSSLVGEDRFHYDSYGNMLVHYASTNGGSSFLSNTANTYNSNGTPSSIFDFAGNQTSYSYSSGCNNLFPTSIAYANSTTEYKTWDCTGGVLLTDQDVNGNTTTYGYQDSGGHADPWWRVRSVTDPLSNKTWITSTVTSENTSFTFNSGASIQNVTTTYDGYGRPINVQKQQSPSSSNYDTVSTTYNFGGVNPTLFTSIPCTEPSGSSCSNGPTKTIDMLGRVIRVADSGSNATDTITYSENDVLSALGPAPSFDGENTKQVQKEYDGIGRLTKSCAIGNGSGTACGQNTGSANGVTTLITYTSASGSQTTTSTRGSQSRSQTVDGMGRVTSSTTPEGGTVHYYYDSYPAGVCGGVTSEPGYLMLVTYANGSAVCFTRDALGRVNGEGAYPSFPTSGTTACRRFFYDNSTGATGMLPTGISPQNPYGRVVEAETDNCTLPLTPISDEWFSYDKDGSMTDMWELTPNSTQYYHSTATFFGNGAVKTLKLASPNLYTSTYGIDGEGRLNTLTVNAQSSVLGTTFNAAGQPTNIAIGTGTDYDGYVYDPNTGRMTNWTFQVNSVQETATLSWNPIGTLKSLAITDGFNSGGTQTCNFGASGTMGYDDWNRLLSDNCGSVWAQTFIYDQYDNLTKSGSLTWNPGYSPTTNHYTLAGTSYDSSGNVTNDSYNAYAWDAFNKMQSVNINGTNCATSGACIVYDAFGRAVEIDSGSTHTEIWYTQLGKTAYMNGTTYSYAYWPAPGGSTILEKTGGFYYFEHMDWLGSARVSSSIGSPSIIDDRAFAPYGEIYDNFGSTSANENIFTGDTQDILATGICCFDTPNRELSANQGRWFSPDPVGAGWNRYAYPTKPNSLVDPSGLNSTYPLVNCCGSNANGDEVLAYDELIFNGVFPGVASDSVLPGGGTVKADSDPPADSNPPQTGSTSVTPLDPDTLQPIGPTTYSFLNWGSGNDSSSADSGGSWFGSAANNGQQQPQKPQQPKPPQPNPPQPQDPNKFFSEKTCFYLDWGGSYLGIVAIPQTWEPVGWALGGGAVAVWAVSKVGGC